MLYFNMAAEHGGSNQRLRGRWTREFEEGLEPGYENQEFRRHAQLHYELRQVRKQLRAYEEISAEIRKTNTKFDLMAKDVRALMSKQFE